MSQSLNSYSSTVDLQLIVRDEVIEVVQTGPDSLTLREPMQLPSGPAKLLIIVDGSTREYTVMLEPSSGVASRHVKYW